MGQGDSATTGEGPQGTSSLEGLWGMGGHKDIRRHRRTLQEDKATMWWGKGKDMVGPEQCGGGRPLSRGGPRGFQGVFRGSQGLLSRCLCFSGWIWGGSRG